MEHGVLPWGGAWLVLSTCNKGMVDPQVRNTLIKQNEIKIKVEMTQGKEKRAKIIKWGPCEKAID